MPFGLAGIGWDSLALKRLPEPRLVSGPNSFRRTVTQ